MEAIKKYVYFLSDAHLGSRAISHRRMQERRLVNFLDSIKHKANSVFLLGDMFDFWFEYRTVVPRGYTRLLGKISELTDHGVEVHYFTGNHDLWMNNYLQRECGVIMHRTSSVVEIYGELFYLAHGDGLDTRDRKFMLLRSIFHNRTCQRLFAALHPRWGMGFGLAWARHSRLKRVDGQEPPYQGPDREPLVVFARQYLKTHPQINHFIFGHRHIEVRERLTDTAEVVILGDWISQFTYARYDGRELAIENYLEGESRP